MLKDMTLGQYYPVDSMVHRLDPRTKLAGTLLYIISLFITNNVVGYAIAFLFLCLCIGLSHVPPKYILKGLKPVLVLMFISIFFNLFFIKLVKSIIHSKKNYTTKHCPEICRWCAATFINSIKTRI